MCYDAEFVTIPFSLSLESWNRYQNLGRTHTNEKEPVGSCEILVSDRNRDDAPGVERRGNPHLEEIGVHEEK